jgi:hypothetical protein
MAIEDWGIEAEPMDAVEDPRRHTLGGFRPGQGFRPSDDDETLTSLEFEADETLTDELPESAGTAALVSRLGKI